VQVRVVNRVASELTALLSMAQTNWTDHKVRCAQSAARRALRSGRIRSVVLVV
jgi:hypothetical protein